MSSSYNNRTPSYNNRTPSYKRTPGHSKLTGIPPLLLAKDDVKTIRRKSYRGLKKNHNTKKARSIKIRPSKDAYKSIVPMFLNMINTVKLYHWKTTSYATHKATDELYAKLNEKIDSFVEVMLGKGEISSGSNRSGLLDVTYLKLHTFNDTKTFIKQIEIYKNFLLNLSHSKFKLLMNVDLLAIRDEILALFNQFLYLLTLNE